MSEAKFTWQGGAISQQMRLALGRANRANAGRLAEYAAELSAPMIKWKKTPDKKCRILAERRNT